MRSLTKLIKTGFYISFVVSLLLIGFIVVWKTSYVSGVLSIEKNWNDIVKNRIHEGAGSSLKISEADEKELNMLLAKTGSMFFVDSKAMGILKDSVDLFISSPSVKNLMKVWDGFDVVLIGARRNSSIFLVIALSLIAVANILILRFVVFKPQEKCLKFVKSISDELSGFRFGNDIVFNRRSPFTEIASLEASLRKVSENLKVYSLILDVTERAKTVGDLTEELDKDLRKIVNFNRIAFARLIEKQVMAEIAFSDSKEILLTAPFTQSVYKTSLTKVMRTGKPRIINDLEVYLDGHPDSRSTKLLVDEGMRSSLTFPIFINDKCIGFLFLNSFERHAFTEKDAKSLEILNEFLSLAYQKTSLAHDLVINATTGFTKLVEGKDNETGNHVVRVAYYSKIIAEELSKDPNFSISPKYVQEIFEQSTLHDIGKVGIPDKVLMKPAKLTQGEFEVIKTHTTIGHGILEGLDKNSNFYGKKFFEMGSKIARYHHEKWDGSGYPDGLKGDGIPLCGRIVAVADVFDALTSKRPYKEAFGYEESMGIIKKGSGGHFDPDVVDAFVKVSARIRRVYEEHRDIDNLERDRFMKTPNSFTG